MCVFPRFPRDFPWEPTTLPWCPAGVGGTPHGKPWDVPREPILSRGMFFSRGVPQGKNTSRGVPREFQYLVCFPRELPLQPVVLDIYARGNQRLVMMVLSCRRRTCRGRPCDPMGHTMGKPVGLPGNFEGIPAEPYGMPWGSGPGRSRGNYWDYPRYAVFSRWSPMGSPGHWSHGFRWESHGFPRELPDSHGKSHNNVNRYIPVPASRTSI